MISMMMFDNINSRFFYYSNFGELRIEYDGMVTFVNRFTTIVDDDHSCAKNHQYKLTFGSIKEMFLTLRNKLFETNMISTRDCFKKIIFAFYDTSNSRMSLIYDNKEVQHIDTTKKGTFIDLCQINKMKLTFFENIGYLEGYELYYNDFTNKVAAKSFPERLKSKIVCFNTKEGMRLLFTDGSICNYPYDEREKYVYVHHLYKDRITLDRNTLECDGKVFPISDLESLAYNAYLENPTLLILSKQEDNNEIKYYSFKFNDCIVIKLMFTRLQYRECEISKENMLSEVKRNNMILFKEHEVTLSHIGNEKISGNLYTYYNPKYKELVTILRGEVKWEIVIKYNNNKIIFQQRGRCDDYTNFFQ
jgi:hypothetical protein